LKTHPVEPAEFGTGSDPGGAPGPSRQGDRVRPFDDAAADSFLHGNGLPRRWQGRPRHTVLDTAFGVGSNFLATWDAWRRDPARCDRLHFVSLERRPLRRDDLRRAHAATPWPPLAAALVDAWPPLTPNLHLLDLDGGRVQLLLAFGDAEAVLSVLRLQADSVFLDDQAPAHHRTTWHPRLVKMLARLAAPGATLATWSVTPELHGSLDAAGFDVERAHGHSGQREITVARWAPRHVPRRPPDMVVAGTQAVVVGAGIAGAAAAQALALQGLEVTVLDRHPRPAAETSGNPAGLFHGTVHPDDGPYARLFRAAALHAARVHAATVCAGGVAGQVQGLLRLDMATADTAAVLRRQRLPADYVHLLDAGAASAAAGVTLPAGAWCYPGGGWIDPAGWVRCVLALPGVRWAGGTAVAALRRDGDAWAVLGADGSVCARAPIVVLANAAGAAPLLSALGHAPWPLRHTRGQVTAFAIDHGLRLPVAGDGYVLPLPGQLLCGATRAAGEPGEAGGSLVRDEDHVWNLQRLHRLSGLQPPPGAVLSGRTAWRLHTDDRMPIAGAVPLAAVDAAVRQDQARLMPREWGLFVLAALGARGLTLAPLLGRLVAAQATGTPWPLEQDLVDAIDPARWAVRAARRAG